jgi:hypothetical protein
MAADREALERLLRYGLRAPFAQERLSLRADGRVIYRLRRPWPTARGATHLILTPQDFLRRLAALVSFPYSHSLRRHGLFANRSRFRRLLPPPPPPRSAQELDLGPAAPPGPGQKAGSEANLVSSSSPASPSAPRKRLPWAQLLRRMLSVEALACPRCSAPGRNVPMVVLAFLTDPEVVSRILRHLGLPTVAPVLGPGRRSGEARGFGMETKDGTELRAADEAEGNALLHQRDGRAPPMRPGG